MQLSLKGSGRESLNSGMGMTPPIGTLRRAEEREAKWLRCWPAGGAANTIHPTRWVNRSTQLGVTGLVCPVKLVTDREPTHVFLAFRLQPRQLRAGGPSPELLDMCH